ncbi:MAG: ribbon-helix-helix protein, CopG family [Flavobacteriales bacterium]|nr:ribbon-helix-helix protein, CopG family [Flavobacteriales bacterium]MBP6696078.1 ribbon-helix-helix protein, CopG family [Flavobacteriales bacterium]
MAIKPPPLKDTNLLVRVDPKFKARIAKAAKKRGKKVSEFIRETLEKEMSSDT